jgi:prepilin-type processing-associated H-X9-DG protein
MLYAAVNHLLPSAFTVHSGTPLYSWRGMILSQIGRKDLQQQLRVDEPWNGPNNGAVANKSVGIYWSPSSAWPDTMTSYLAVVGRHSAIAESGDVRNSLDYIAKNGDPSKLIMVIEVPNSGINWLEPRDLSVDQLKQNGLRGLIPSGGSALRPEGFNVLFADGHVETLPTDIDPQKLAPMLEVDPGVGSNK